MPVTEKSSFLKSIARYFMDFLETDFHRRRVPRRSIKLKNESGQLLGVAADKYPAFDKEAWQVLGRKFDDGGVLNIRRNQFKADIPKNLMELITRKIEAFTKDSVEAVTTELSKSIENYGASLKDEYTKAKDKVENDLTLAVEDNLTTPLIDSIEKSLLLLETADENTAFQIKAELTELFVTNIMPVAETVLQAVIIGEEVDVNKRVKSTINLKLTKSLLTDYFEDLAANDLYQELSEIESNRLILDKQELYLYFCDISYQNARYPLFYVPAQIDRQGDQLKLNFDSKLYINKKAVEYIAQEVGNEDSSVSGNPLDFDRIMYLTTFENTEAFTTRLHEIVNNLVTYFDLRGDINFEAQRSMARNAKVRITNSAYVALFDKSDEALINDYEQILDLDVSSELFELFQAIVNGFITEEPKDVAREVERDWDEQASTDKLAFESPVPLNSEQIQILRALEKDDCRFLTVEGPPGTGKSHTITALVFNAILQNKSVLVLSDKKEALDVVEEKIGDTLDKVRFGSDFQNPILRLGGVNNFRQILSSQAIENIKLAHKLTGKKLDQLEDSIHANLEVTKDQIRKEIESYGKININELIEVEELERELQQLFKKVNTQELIEINDVEVVLHEVRQSYDILNSALEADSETLKAIASLGLLSADKIVKLKLNNLVGFTNLMTNLAEHTASVNQELDAQSWQNVFTDFPNITDEDVPEISKFILRFDALKKPVIGFAFNKTKLIDLLGEFNKAFDTNFVNPSADINRIKSAHNAFTQLLTLKEGLPFPEALKTKLNYLRLLSKALTPNISDAIQSASQWHDEGKYIQEVSLALPINFKDTNEMSVKEIGSLPLMSLEELEAEKLMRWLHLMDSVNLLTDEVPFYSYQQYMQTIQRQVTLRMAQILDGRVIDFYTDSRATATVVKDVIKAKQKFPKETFAKLKEAFPCILAGIREYADYIPLEAGIFDLVIIDEASQVSVAQAFPALIRGKKVVIMGDRLQFGNVKSYQARTEINTEYQNRLQEAFAKTVSNDLSSLKKIERLNVKKSILDFAEYVSNFQIMLKKHFRGYPENISFSNHYFYSDALQVMKVRGKSIDEVLKFTVIDHDGKLETRPNTNLPEAEFIISQLKKLAEKNDNSNTVGIITPHTNQQKHIFELLRNDPNFDFYINKLRLKVMTFDSCQGEERDIIYYSMVATETDDKLGHIFPRDLMQNSYDNDSDSEIRRQRLNVGFSRSKETMHFVLSKPVENYRGSIGVAISHYYNLKAEVKKRLTSEAVDKNSPMEARALKWIYDTPFWQKNNARCELHAQFELGQYLSQLDPTYHHPNYVVDFILFYKDEKEKTHKIIFEYDGFNEHIEEGNRQHVDSSNFDSYLKEEDIYRQKVLESYGYEFIRLNRFNVGSNPVEYVNNRIEQLLDGSMITNSVGHDIDAIIKGQAMGLHNGELKECQSCGRVIPVDEFKDSTLASGVGRVCRDCKGKKTITKSPKAKKASSVMTGQPCPRCGRKMMLRNGRFGKFYGCSGFPYCKYTQDAVST
jgi:very-short-patch-repair endonuclease